MSLQREELREFGKFTFVSTDKDISDLPPETLARLIFLGTHLKYNSDSLYVTERRAMKVRELASILHLSDATTYRFLDDVRPCFVYTDDEGNLHIKNKILHFGVLPGKSNGYRKVYNDAIQRLYKSTPVKCHRQLGYIFLMLPYINIEHNILCWNPYEKNFAKVEPMAITDFCEKIGMNLSNISRLRKAYSKIRFAIDGRQELFCLFLYDGIHQDESRIFVNPHIVYSGSGGSVKEAMSLFIRECATDKHRKNPSTDCLSV